MATSSNSQMEASLNLCTNSTAQELLKCFFCDKFLSVPPIYNHEFESICGRCKFVNKSEDSKWTRQTLYEDVARFMIFPCSNSTYGCKAQLKWGDVEEHENTCLYKKLNCPFACNDIFHVEKCRWMGSGPGLNEHLEFCHGDVIKKLPEINFSESRANGIFLTRILKQLMIVVVKYDPPDTFSCMVMVNGTSTDCEAYRYQLELFDENKRNSLILRRSRLEDAVGFEENLTNPEKMLVVELQVVKSLLKKPATIMGRFGIIKKSKRELNFGDKPQECPFDENFLRELECPVCKNYMVPPIQICSTGHSFCSRCRDQMEECPTCRHPFQEGRNYTLEKLTTCINYPCMFRDAGCTVACPSEKLREHELDCSFSGIQCFLECNTGPVMNLFKHLNEKHRDRLIVAGEVHILDLGEGEVMKTFAICFGNDMFRLAVFYDGDIKFSLQQFGVKQSCYTYELEIICTTDCSEKIILTKECPPMSTTFWSKSITVPDDLIQRFISEEDLVFFKINLRKMV
ncbi:uncharacterized protein LOC663065 isoform X1 [Tribolium castaneum]|uniref:RING-type E3 ubiquitin transferase n=2 Tax=Tribolium castaneum TaxID=7070 RepID=D6WEL1_TRICA|nr:PREDICTED: uncharacterized protein LOC663065 isoform X1 [Tribolium castaneum]XP_974219.1 PREDICTED: uncharacterized protein LOC663065 isoform X1 [Tribolium castaneum]EFA00429.2 hypothetical protein TcasGA2_TC003283 [Tribolium castaneum]|eukprot:XP_008190582.1 PREDICTED: uncharacterized protein LOC663065 isoform X1 [Tribolium castaneum]